MADIASGDKRERWARRPPTDADEWFRHSQKLLFSTKRVLKALPLVESGNKIRVATLHDAAGVHCARVVTRRIMPVLSLLQSTRSTLAGEGISLSPQGNVTYSADLSKATDYFSHELAEFMTDLLCDALGETDATRAILKQVLGPHWMRHPDTGEELQTKRGVHMGIGAGWSLLCLANAWAAWDAGAPRDSYAICGDDLIGAWETRTCERYEENLTRIGLVCNKEKSFRGPRGVFCEQLVLPVGQCVVSRPCKTLAEAAGAKHGWGSGADWYSVLEHLGVSLNREARMGIVSSTSDLARRTVKRLAPLHCPSGPLSLGGRGLGPIQFSQLAASTVMRTRWKGDKEVDRNVKDAYARAHALAQTRPRPGAELNRVQAHQLVATAASMYMQRKEYERPRAPHYKEYAAHGRAVIRCGRRLLKEKSLEELVRQSDTISVKTKRKILWRLKLHHNHHQGSQKGLSGIAQLLEVKKELFTPEEELVTLLNGTLQYKNCRIREALGAKAKKERAS